MDDQNELRLSAGEHDDVAAAENTTEDQQEHLVEDLNEGASPGHIGALDGAAAVGSLGAVSGPDHDSEIPGGAPDPSIGPD
ncbi:hypothetical protein ABZY58_07010 [Micromonospora tulbaghiae]|uniref:hypothetical protein n=1 Tax=Micromonospora tulbaghiae TaxID=479978 RepID=UPI0033AE583B